MNTNNKNNNKMDRMAAKAGLHNNNNKGNYYRGRRYDYTRKVDVVIIWESSEKPGEKSFYQKNSKKALFTAAKAGMHMNYNKGNLLVH